MVRLDYMALSQKAYHSHRASARCKALTLLRNRFNGFRREAQKKPLKRFSANVFRLAPG